MGNATQNHFYFSVSICQTRNFFLFSFHVKKNLELAIFGRGNFYAKLVWHKNCIRDKIDFGAKRTNYEILQNICERKQKQATPDTSRKRVVSIQYYVPCSYRKFILPSRYAT